MQSENDVGFTTDSSVEDEVQRQDIQKFNRLPNVRSIIPRKNVGDGFWLCGLLPLALTTHYVGYDFGCSQKTYNSVVLAVIGMSIKSICFFAYIKLDAGLYQFQMLISLLPGLVTAWLYMAFQKYYWYEAILFGFAITTAYQKIYVAILRSFPGCFTFGEAAVLVQGLVAFLLNVCQQMPKMIFSVAEDPVEIFPVYNKIMMFALFCLFITCVLLAKIKFLRKPVCFYFVMLILAVIVTCAPITKPIPIIVIFRNIFLDQTKLLLIVYFILMLILTYITVALELKVSTNATTKVRKFFHVMILLVYIPGLFIQCALLYIGTGVALALMTIVELFRICNIPPFNDFLKAAFRNFRDEKDADLLALTPFCLLIGCSLPLWIMPCPCLSECQTHPSKMLAILSGILTIGIGDAAASFVGSTFGKHNWRNSNRTKEGTLAFIISVLLATYILTAVGILKINIISWFYIIGATVLTALIEAFTDQIDNLTLPLIFYTVVNLVKEVKAF